MTETNYESAVAIIGMSGRFPAAGGVDELWRNLIDGRIGLRAVTEEELTAADVSPALVANPAYVRTAAPLEGIDLFDASMFGFSRREAETTEPQHRLFMECAWEALESAGYAPNRAPGKVGVFAGCGYPDYMAQVAARLANEAGGDLLVAIGTERDSLASLVSYKLDLRGPSVTVQTFCSTSLVAVHFAVQSLLSFESDMVIAGGAYVALPQPTGYLFQEGGITTPDGRVRSFDAGARGTVLGNGVAVVALKRMTEAIADGDVIHAVILGSATNNDGRACAGYTAPGVDGQSEVIELALAVADVKPETVGYVECHATGTMLGDSIELAAMGRVFDRPMPTPCVLSTLKSTLGHLDRASGATGLIRATLALRHRTLPGTPGFETPNPTLAALQDRFEVLTEPRPWPAGDLPRRAGVSSFGFGGTNAHVVLEEAPQPPPRGPIAGPHLLVLSARDLTALYAAIEQLMRHLDQHRDLDPADVAYTLQQSRTGFSMRWAAVCEDTADALAALADPGRWVIGEASGSNTLVSLAIPDPGRVPDRWWRDLGEAVTALVPTSTYDAGAPPHVGALRAVVAALHGMGMRLRLVGTDRAEREVAEQLAAELGLARAGTGPDDQPATETTIGPEEDESAQQWLLTTIARLWLAGAAIDWTALRRGEPRRVMLPTYPFQRRRYWVESAPRGEGAPLGQGKTADLAQWTYLASWRRRHRPVADLAERLRAASPWLVFVAEECGETVVRHLSDAGADVTAVRPGTAFARTVTGDFVVRPDSAEDMRRILASTVLAPRTVVHGFSLGGTEPGGSDPAEHFDAAQVNGFHSVRALVGALDDATSHVDITVLTDAAVGVVGSDLRHPEHATLVGLVPVLGQENPSLSARHVDVDAADQARRHRLASLAEHVLAEAVDEHEGPVAWRVGTRWVRSYESQPLPAPSAAHSPIRPGACVLITGGLGHVGLILARHLAARDCRLVLTVRSSLPPRDQWSNWLRETGAVDDKIRRYLRNIIDLEGAGAQVLAVSADVADPGQMAEVVRAARERFGRIDAVVHGAGVQDSAFFGAAHTLDHGVAAAHFRAKVHGFHSLQRVLDQDTVVRVTLSSLSTVLGGIGFGPYAAANAALDAYALAAREGEAGDWLTVDWDAWRIGSANGGARTSVSEFEMAPEEATDVFERAIRAGGPIGALVVSTGALSARLDTWVLRAGRGGTTGSGDAAARDPRPALPNPYIAPAEGVEAVLADLWAAVLGLDRVGVEDDFYRLGGDSVTAIDLTARVRRQLQVSVPVTALLECPTVRGLAARLQTQRSATV